MREAKVEDPRAALERGIITRAEAERIAEMDEAVDRAIEVDSFAPHEIMAGAVRREEAAE